MNWILLQTASPPPAPAKSIQGWFMQNIWLIIGIYALVFVAAILYVSIRNRGKIFVRIKGTRPEKEIWKKPDIINNKITMEKPKGKVGIGWTLKYDPTCLIQKKGFLGIRSFEGIEAWPNALYAIPQLSALKPEQQAQWDKKREEELFEAGVIKAAGQTGQKLQVPMALYMLIVVSIIVTVIFGLLGSGRIHIG